MAKMIELSTKEIRKLASDQDTFETVIDILVSKAERELAAVDPDLPQGSQDAKRERIRAKLREDVARSMHEARERADLASGQAEYHTREAELFRAAFSAPSQVTVLAQNASSGQLPVLAKVAAARGDFTLSGAVAWAAAGKEMTTNERLAIARELNAAAWPDLSATESRLREIRDAYLRAELKVMEVAPAGDTTARLLELGRALKAPVLPSLAPTFGTETTVARPGTD